MPERQTLTESRPSLLVEATATAGVYRVQLINPGWGSSGFYSSQILAEAARTKVFGAGLHMYADHPTAVENEERPERSVRDLWGVLTSDATIGTGGSLVAEAKVFAPYRPLVDDMKESIGLSIRALGQFEMGEAEGRTGRLITSLDEARSVDFVTAAGRGGRILELVESARGEALTETTARMQLAEARNVGQWIESRLHLSLTQIADEMFGEGRLTREERIALSGAVGDGLQAFTAALEQSAPQLYARDLWDQPDGVTVAEATANDTREALATAVTDAYGNGPDAYAWVRDYDPDAGLVIFDVSGTDNANGTFQQAYEIAADGTAALTGTRTEVSVRTTYVPVDPAGQSNTTESQGGTMPDIEEARLRQLETDAGRVPTLESERDAANQRAEAVERQLAESNARTAARPIVAAVLAEGANPLPAPITTRVTESVVAAARLTDAGVLDEVALRTAATEARTAAETELAAIAESLGVGQVRGLGASTTPPGELTESAYDARSGRTFGRQTVKGA